MTPKLIRVLLVEDDLGDALWIKELLEGAQKSFLKFELQHCNCLSEALASEPFQNSHHFGLRINLTAFHAHPLRYYTRSALCLSPKGSSILAAPYP